MAVFCKSNIKVSCHERAACLHKRGNDQPAQKHSLISADFVLCLNDIITGVQCYKVSCLLLVLSYNYKGNLCFNLVGETQNTSFRL